MIQHHFTILNATSTRRFTPELPQGLKENKCWYRALSQHPISSPLLATDHYRLTLPILDRWRSSLNRCYPALRPERCRPVGNSRAPCLGENVKRAGSQYALLTEIRRQVKSSILADGHGLGVEEHRLKNLWRNRTDGQGHARTQARRIPQVDGRVLAILVHAHGAPGSISVSATGMKTHGGSVLTHAPVGVLRRRRTHSTPDFPDRPC